MAEERCCDLSGCKSLPQLRCCCQSTSTPLHRPGQRHVQLRRTWVRRAGCSACLHGRHCAAGSVFSSVRCSRRFVGEVTARGLDDFHPVRRIQVGAQGFSGPRSAPAALLLGQCSHCGHREKGGGRSWPATTARAAPHGHCSTPGRAQGPPFDHRRTYGVKGGGAHADDRHIGCDHSRMSCGAGLLAVTSLMNVW